ncbi:hypothetical protein PUNSTDRAFT_117024 [Punctularia strigosozonata HHB-11173 SS5]|uniref:Helitron helicase-like domain-containing protein n=1 Tax=Punctularia strigosozonata (strain HHB-11173) TaxID=741275 RepID=R7S0W5_PUNST|nr:uncharacterized protein PUNSTDRAFT_117024 [Punctularia strigosozonata HHB-11173 SS5]EIN03437.1 hypothetical protein PUNSTDRAFT_117024 [Punctularia strigosozonata HHB-11173 SS5]
MYHDKRFQVDEYFPFIVFNQDQISQASIAGILMAKRKHMRHLPNRIKMLDQEALESLIRRGEEGEYLKPETPAEQNCFDILRDLQYVHGHVQGSTTARKSLRKEIKSLMYENGAFTLFVTFSPVDFKHPICLYYSDTNGRTMTELNTRFPDVGERLRMISSNPVACARFFHLMVDLFVKKLLRPTEGGGLFGDTEAYYGT